MRGRGFKIRNDGQLHLLVETMEQVEGCRTVGWSRRRTSAVSICCGTPFGHRPVVA